MKTSRMAATKASSSSSLTGAILRRGLVLLTLQIAFQGCVQSTAEIDLEHARRDCATPMWDVVGYAAAVLKQGC